LREGYAANSVRMGDVRLSGGGLGTVGSSAFVSALSLCLSFLPPLVDTRASAADLYGGPPGLKDGPARPVSALWQGLYLGGNLGGAWNNFDVTDTYTYYGDPTARNSADGTGLIGGAQAGYNFQRGNFVYGLEADLGYLNLSASKAVALQADPHNDAYWLSGNYSSSGGLYGDLTGRLGYTAGRALLYVKGGAAFLNADFKASYLGQNYTGTPHAFNFDHCDTLFGWTLGAGVEYAMSPRWSLKIEYQHFDFSNTSYEHNSVYVINPATGWHSTLTGSADVSPSADAIKVGLNYHLDAGADLN
jgi:outer membrane immunogenic protein